MPNRRGRHDGPGGIRGHGGHAAHDGHGGPYRDWHHHRHRPAWAVYWHSPWFAAWYGYPRWGYSRWWGAYHRSVWPYYGYYSDYWYDPGIYYRVIYYNPTLYVPLPFGGIACNAFIQADVGVPAAEPVADVAAGPEEVIPAEPVPGQAGAGDQFVAAAEVAFREGRYQDAVTKTNHALVESPNDGYVILLLSQALFATGDYRGAITAAYRGMSQLDTDQWGFVVEHYANYYGNNDYVTQMRKLNAYIESHPDSAYAYALRGYHFGYLGYDGQARADLAKAIELEPRDPFARQLYTLFGGKAPPPAPELNPPAGKPAAPAHPRKN